MIRLLGWILLSAAGLRLFNDLPLILAAERAAGDHLHFNRFSSESGLPAAEVFCISEDRRGFLWFGTADGLARYDGHEFRVFRHDPDDPSSLADNIVRDIKSDSAGNLWLATDRGLDLWSSGNENFTHYRNEPNDPTSLSGNAVRALLPDADGTLWVGTFGNGLNRLDPRTRRFERFMAQAGNENGLSDNRVRALIRDRRGIIWIGTYGGGLNQLNPATHRLRRFYGNSKGPNNLAYERVSSVCEGGDGFLWVGTQDGLLRIDPVKETFERFSPDPGNSAALQSAVVWAVMADTQGRLWVGTDHGGLSRYEPALHGFIHYRCVKYDPDTLATDSVTAIYQDYNGGLWTGHSPGGVSLANRLSSVFRTYRSLPGIGNSLSHDNVRALSEDRAGNIWVGTDGGGLNSFDRAAGHWRQYRQDPRNSMTLGSNVVSSLYWDTRDQLWIGTWNGGLNRFDPHTGGFRHYLPENGRLDSISSPHIWQILEDRQHQLWIATHTGGICRYIPSKDSFHQYRHVPEDPRSLNDDTVWSLLLTRSGDLWAGTNSGLAKWESASDAWRRFESFPNQPDAIGNNAIVDLLEDRESSIWLATRGAGLIRMDPRTKKTQSYQLKDGLPSNVVLGLLEDDSGALWVSTNNGLARFIPRLRQILVFDQEDGLQGRQFNRGSRLRTRAGELAFGGTQGFSMFDPRQIRLDTAEPRVVLTRFEVFNQVMTPGGQGSPLLTSITETDRLEIPARLSVISFQFAALDFRSPASRRFVFKLEGFDPDWRAAGAERRAIYTNLDPGQYVLRVKTTNGEGTWIEGGAKLQLIIVPPWWKTWWFRLTLVGMVVVSLIATGWAISGWRMKQRMREAEQGRQIALERQRAAEALQQRDEQLLQAHKMESVGRLAGGVAHELNNMLTPILGYTELMRADMPANSSHQADLAEVARAAERARDLVQQLLAFARKQALEMKVINLNSVITGFENMLRHTLREDISLKISLAPSLHVVKGDIGQIEQIILNLAVNAQDAMPGGGTLVIETRELLLNEARMQEDEGLQAGSFVMLTVEDTGVGMDKETLDRVFEPFFTTKGMGKGTGLGLATVYGIVKQHGGHISIASEPGHGTVFRLYFPHAETCDAPNTAVASRAEGTNGTETILLAEDQEEVRSLVARMLTRLGYTVLQARDAATAIQIVDSHKGPVHLLITDVVLPDQNGKIAYETISASRRETKVLYISGYSGDVISNCGVLDEGVDFLPKPFTAHTLATRVREILERT